MTPSSVLQWFFECRHSTRSRVFTINKRTYQICLDCGQEIPYLWEQMGSLKPSIDASDHRAPGDGGGEVRAELIVGL